MLKPIRFDEIRVTITDSEGSTFHRDWKATANRRDAIRWTLESGDVPFYVTEDQICSITVEIGEETK